MRHLCDKCVHIHDNSTGSSIPVGIWLYRILPFLHYTIDMFIWCTVYVCGVWSNGRMVENQVGRPQNFEWTNKSALRFNNVIQICLGPFVGSTVWLLTVNRECGKSQHRTSNASEMFGVQNLQVVLFVTNHI